MPDKMAGTRSVAIAFCSDLLMEAPLHVAASSLLQHLDPQVTAHFYFLLTGFSESAQNCLRNTLEAVGRPFQATFLPDDTAATAFQHCSSLHGSLTTYYRLVLPNLIDEPRFLYLDVDTLPLIDVAPLFELDMGGFSTGFVVDGRVADNLEHRLFFSLGRAPESPSFNAGVMLVQPDSWRRRGDWQRVLAFLNQYGSQLLSHDQTVLNALFGEDCFHLDLDFNRKIYPSARSSISANPGLYHFVGVPKPWDLGGRILLPYAKLWFDKLHRTALPTSRKLFWLTSGYWKRAPHMLGGYRRLLKSLRARPA
jgi:lipopolysaccharide biosynthesis glycosyltransferase